VWWTCERRTTGVRKRDGMAEKREMHLVDVLVKELGVTGAVNPVVPGVLEEEEERDLFRRRGKVVKGRKG
jgi:hypothetical protein